MGGLAHYPVTILQPTINGDGTVNSYLQMIVLIGIEMSLMEFSCLDAREQIR
jgi:hypothetical protein